MKSRFCPLAGSRLVAVADFHGVRMGLMFPAEVLMPAMVMESPVPFRGPGRFVGVGRRSSGRPARRRAHERQADRGQAGGETAGTLIVGIREWRVDALLP